VIAGWFWFTLNELIGRKPPKILIAEVFFLFSIFDYVKAYFS